MTSFRKSSGKARFDPEAAQSYNIRFDYSDIYLDNDDLDLELEDHDTALNKEKLKAMVETDETLKLAKNEADEMLELKNKIKNRDPKESTYKVIKSANLKHRKSQKQLLEEGKGSITKTEGVDGDKANTDDILVAGSADATNTTTSNTGAVQLNNLTMFLLSLQKFKTNKNRPLQDDKTGIDSKQDIFSKSETVKKKLHKRPSTVPARKLSCNDTIVEIDTKPVQYGIHVKKDFTRSRRTLEKISRLEQDSKYGHVNKYEERRKRLLASCKDTSNVDERITNFIKDVEEFNKVTGESNTLEKVRMRAKSASYKRTPTVFW